VKAQEDDSYRVDLPPENILRHYDLALYSHQRYIFVICLDGT
jgi:hypothetical protein